MARLIRVEQGEETVFEVEEAIIAIGRGGANHVPVADAAASRKHCQIMSSATGFVIEDLGSKHGTLLNGQPLAMKRLEPGDRIEIGRTIIYWLEKREAERKGVKKTPSGVEDITESLGGGAEEEEGEAGEEEEGRKPKERAEEEEEDEEEEEEAKPEPKPEAPREPAPLPKSRREPAAAAAPEKTAPPAGPPEKPPSASDEDEELIRGFSVKAVEGPLAGKSKSRRASETLTIGSAVDCDLTIAGDPDVLPSHAEILSSGGRYFIVAAPGAAVEVDGQSGSGRTEVKKGARIRIGKSVFEFQSVKLRPSGRVAPPSPGDPASSLGDSKEKPPSGREGKAVAAGRSAREAPAKAPSGREAQSAGARDPKPPSGREAGPKAQALGESAPPPPRAGAADADIPVAAPAEAAEDSGVTDLSGLDYERALARARRARALSLVAIGAIGIALIFYAWKFAGAALRPVERDRSPEGNLVLNWSFESLQGSRPAEWTLPASGAVDEESAAGGRRSLFLSARGEPAVASPAEPLVIPTTDQSIQVRASVRVEAGGRAGLRLRWLSGEDSLTEWAAIVEEGGRWRDAGGLLLPPAGATGFVVECVAIEGDARFDRVQVYRREARAAEWVDAGAGLAGAVDPLGRVVVYRGDETSFSRALPFVGSADASESIALAGASGGGAVVSGGREIPFATEVTTQSSDLAVSFALSDVPPGAPCGVSLVAHGAASFRIVSGGIATERLAGFDPTPAEEIVWGAPGSQVALRLRAGSRVSSTPALGGCRLDIEAPADAQPQAPGTTRIDLVVSAASSEVRAEQGRLLDEARSREAAGEIGSAISLYLALVGPTYPPAVREEARQAAERLRAEAERMLADADAVMTDYRAFSIEPIRAVLDGMLAEIRRKLAGLSPQVRMQRLLQEASTLPPPDPVGVAATGTAPRGARELIDLGNDHVNRRLFRLARAFFEEAIRRAPEGSAEAREARERLDAALRLGGGA